MSIKINRVIRSKRKTIALIVERDASVTIRAPMKITNRAIREFIEKHEKWVEKKQAEVLSINPPPARRYHAGETFLYLGQAYRLEIIQDANKDLVLDGTFRLAASAQSNAWMIFRNWYRKQARMIISERVARFAAQYQLPVGKIRITSARTRWGSCSSKGALSFSWRLIMTPVDVIDYVVVHELAHMIHHNHSPKFWKLVETWMPDYKECKKQLRRYSQESI